MNCPNPDCGRIVEIPKTFPDVASSAIENEGNLVFPCSFCGQPIKIPIGTKSVTEWTKNE